MTTFCPECQRPLFDDLIHECRQTRVADPLEQSLWRENVRLAAMNRYLAAELAKALSGDRPARRARSAVVGD